MSFDFLGTFNQAQLERFVAYARDHLDLVESRKRHLALEVARIGTIIFRHDKDGNVVGYTATPTNSLLGKLLRAYEVLGGNPELDLDVRLRSDPIYRRTGDEVNGLSPYMSNGEVIGAEGLADAPSALLMASLMAPFRDSMDYQFNRLERKIRRAVDYADQLQLEIQALQKITSDQGFESIVEQIKELLSDRNYRAIHAGQDPRGAGNYAPFSSYESGGLREGAVGPQREERGLVEPGEKS